jgi:hypothetical protein
VIDKTSSVDIESKLNKIQAKKLLGEFFKKNPNSVSFTNHAQKQMAKRDLTSTDVINVLRAGKIYNEPEYENGTYRYRVETTRIMVIFAFRSPNKIVIVSAWRKQ